ncbi:oligopeptidase B [Lujinxingia litoralis]|uniref:Oligopeptidase B n=1 Tax=Lujinxingia litoralis TaxID=2211119 RepID=A0A328C0L0_9DELT|nr:S9 family peptidase [Lujinxingia litoralis]RAL20118.1 oligopeptidase B [Lujinxingia litoralis]
MHLHRLQVLGTTLALSLAACATTPATTPASQTLPGAPVAPRVDTLTEIHGRTLVDPYAWLRDRDNPDTIAYLEAENAYAASAMAHTAELQETLYQELLSRIDETDLSVPVKRGDYFYYSRTEEGKDYPTSCRKLATMDADEEIILDQNALAQGHDYFAVGAFEVSDDQRLLAYSIDTRGNERYALYVVDLHSDEILAGPIENTSSVAWANDNKTLFYTTLDHANRPSKVFRHTLGQDPAQDSELHHERDEAFYAYVSRSRSGDFIMMTLWSNASGESRFLPADAPEEDFQILAPRAPGVEYRVAHHGDHFLIVTNEDAINFKLMRAPTTNVARDHWEELLPHRPDVMLRAVHAFKDWWIFEERAEGSPRLRALELATGLDHVIEMPEPVYSLRFAENPSFDTATIRFNYSSLITPQSVFDYDLQARQTELKKESAVHHYDRTNYVSQRIYAPSSDGVQVPISIVHKKGIALDSSHPLLLLGYGSYGMNYDPYFSASRVALLERGVIFAIAHIRGGGELGRPWYLDGKLERKQNTFDDFIAASEHLIARGYTSANRLAINGGSAGGLLMGAVLNQRPDLFQAAIADVPFVDVVNTMLDASLPLTVVEYAEWGNPNDPQAFETIYAYSPYDNVRAQDYPDLLVTAGLNDPRVHYWEPAKWVAKLRATRTDTNLTLLQTNMGAGHGGASGRYGWYRETAFTYAFILDRLGVTEPAAEPTAPLSPQAQP